MARRISPADAREILQRCGINSDEDFHALPVSQVDALVEEARRFGYRKPRHANGSRARYFYEYLRRTRV